MNLFEYQAKEIFNQRGISIPKGMLIEKIEEIDSVIEIVGCPCVIKSQVLTGGRGKSGLVQIVENKQEATIKAQSLFDTHLGKNLLIEKVVDFEREIYLSITIDPYEAKAIMMACPKGGVDIEILAARSPEKIVAEKIDMSQGLMGFQIRNIVYPLNLSKELVKQAVQVIRTLYQVFEEYDAELVEINPLFISKEGDLVAGDAKLNIDDNSLYKHPEYALTRGHFSSDLEFDAALEGIPYLQFTGDISLMCAGAGLTNTVFDLIHDYGGTVANYLEFGGPNYRKAHRAMELCLANKSKTILIVTFGTIARADVIAEGVVEAIEELKPDRQIITCIRGTNEDKAMDILRNAGLNPLFDTEEAVRSAVEIARRRAN